MEAHTFNKISSVKTNGSENGLANLIDWATVNLPYLQSICRHKWSAWNIPAVGVKIHKTILNLQKFNADGNPYDTIIQRGLFLENEYKALFDAFVLNNPGFNLPKTNKHL